MLQDRVLNHHQQHAKFSVQGKDGDTVYVAARSFNGAKRAAKQHYGHRKSFHGNWNNFRARFICWERGFCDQRRTDTPPIEHNDFVCK